MQKSLNFSVEFVLGDRRITQSAEVRLYLSHWFSSLMTDVGDRFEQPYVLYRRDDTGWFALYFTMMDHHLGFHVYSD